MTSAQGLFQRGGSLTPAVVEYLEGLGGDAGTFAQVLATGGDPEGEAVTGNLTFSDDGTEKATFCVDGSDATLKLFDQGGSAGAALAVSNDGDTNWLFFVSNQGQVGITHENSGSGERALSVTVGATLVLEITNAGRVNFSSANFFLNSLPTANPNVAGQVYRNGNTLMISTG